MSDSFLLFLVAVPLLGVLAQWIAWRLQIPSILLLLSFGIALGLVVSPDAILAEVTGADEGVGARLLFPLVSLSVAIILFEGGLTLRWNQIRDSSQVLIRIITVSALLTWLMTALLARHLVGFDWSTAWLLGAVLIVTGPTVVGPLLRQIRPNRRVGSLLQWEAILIDPIGAVAAVLVFEAISQPAGLSVSGVASSVLATLMIGGIVGCGTAILLIHSLKRYWIPDYLHGVLFLVSVLSVFYVSNLIRPESGLVTVTILGLYLANQQSVSVAHVLEFKEHLRVLLISCLFIVLGSRLQPSDLAELGGSGVLFVLILIFVIRPLSVGISLLGSHWTWKEKLFVGLVAPRGIVAASVASVFGLKLAMVADHGALQPSTADQLAPLTFLVILGTVAVCGLGAGPLARRLNLSDRNPQGILFAGAARWVRELAVVLRRQGIPVLLVDTNYSNVTAAKLAELNAVCGNILSEHLREEQQLSGIGKLLAVTPSDEVNTLATIDYLHLFSRANVYQLVPEGKNGGRWQSIPPHRRGRQLFDQQLTHGELERLFEAGATIKSTTLTESFTMNDFRNTHGGQVIPLFLISREGTLKIRTLNGALEPQAGDRVIAILPGGIPRPPQDISSTR